MKIYVAQAKHVYGIFELEKQCYPETNLRQNQIAKIVDSVNSDGHVIIDKQDKILAYILYDKTDTQLEIIRLGVHPYHRRCGHATRLIEKVKSKMTTNKNRIIIHVPDDLLDGHLFLQHCGFIATGIDYRHYRRHTDSYAFTFLRDWLECNTQPTPNEEDIVSAV